MVDAIRAGQNVTGEKEQLKKGTGKRGRGQMTSQKKKSEIGGLKKGRRRKWEPKGMR